MTVTDNDLNCNGPHSVRYPQTLVTGTVYVRYECCIIGNGLCGGQVGVGPARLIGNGRHSVWVTDIPACNGPHGAVTNGLLQI